MNAKIIEKTLACIMQFQNFDGPGIMIVNRDCF